MPGICRVGDQALCPADSHGCLKCAHQVQGPATVGSPDVFINGMPALRVGDTGVHAGCCGPNTWTAAQGSSTVFINGLPAVMMGHMTQHCGGVGSMVEGSSNVFIGDINYSTSEAGKTSLAAGFSPAATTRQTTHTLNIDNPQTEDASENPMILASLDQPVSDIPPSFGAQPTPTASKGLGETQDNEPFIDEITPVAQYIAGEMNTNAHGDEAKKIYGLNTYSEKECMDQYRNQPWFSRLLNTDMAIQCSKNSFDFPKAALLSWALNVWQGARWDHKTIIPKKFHPRDKDEQQWHLYK